ncbi:MAG: hypothetical protein CO188_09715 [Zetaproteobacteria bacterium CG_4_9_14_3_um_filter_54_145]|nr:MAG: hypothetical protein COZ50_12670 [Zetaproteobacteria bacterium CG_4_10_14_3_um_filter_54_28]PJA28305.1 MAG: hypothetical protein CO188_09715 [Zetaproteobacteria bacterium CG_4_9_14_3_um_filter_54_145]
MVVGGLIEIVAFPTDKILTILFEIRHSLGRMVLAGVGILSIYAALKLVFLTLVKKPPISSKDAGPASLWVGSDVFRQMNSL